MLSLAFKQLKYLYLVDLSQILLDDALINVVNDGICETVVTHLTITVAAFEPNIQRLLNKANLIDVQFLILQMNDGKID